MPAAAAPMQLRSRQGGRSLVQLRSAPAAPATRSLVVTAHRVEPAADLSLYLNLR